MLNSHLCRVYTSRVDNQVAKEKLTKKYFLYKLAQYFVCEMDRTRASNCNIKFEF